MNYVYDYLLFMPLVTFVTWVIMGLHEDYMRKTTVFGNIHNKFGRNVTLEFNFFWFFSLFSVVPIINVWMFLCSIHHMYYMQKEYGNKPKSGLKARGSDTMCIHCGTWQSDCGGWNVVFMDVPAPGYDTANCGSCGKPNTLFDAGIIKIHVDPDTLEQIK